MTIKSTNLPTFLIAGAAKAGTSSLYNYLRQHPEIYMPTQLKESYYLCDLPDQGYQGIRRHFRVPVTEWHQYCELFAGVTTEHKAVGEACPAYLYFYESTIPRIVKLLGLQTKIIIVLRDPVERAFSGYMHAIRDTTESLTFDAALAAEEERIKDGWWWGYHYAQIGYYTRQVEAYINTFGREQIHLLLYDDFQRQPHATLAQILRFLEVDDTFTPDMSVKYNSTGIPKFQFLHNFLLEPNVLKRIVSPMLPKEARRRLRHRIMHKNLRNKPRMTDTAQMRLSESYQQDLKQLQLLTELDLSGWNYQLQSQQPSL